MKNVHLNIVPFILIVAASQFVILAVSASYPILATLLTFLSIGCSLYILLFWALPLVLRKIWGKAVQIRWNKLLPQRHTPKREKKALKDPIVPVAQLKHLRSNVQRLGLALHGMTPEMEKARRTHFQLLGKALPSLTLPPQNAVLYAEFESLIKILNHFGFPFLESVRLQQKDFGFLQKWECDLQSRFLQLQKHFQDQQQANRSALSTTIQAHQSIGVLYPAALNNADYQRIQGALMLLEKMVQDSRCPKEPVLGSIEAIQRDMNRLSKQLKQAAAINSSRSL